MADIKLRYTLYDTWQPSTVANAQATLFQVPQGGDATHTQSFTNMRGAGALPQTEMFEIDWIGLVVDSAPAVADILKLFYGGIAEIRVADFSMLVTPLSLLVARSAYSGDNVQATPADTPTIGLLGDGFYLDQHIMIGGAIPFKVLLTQSQALAATRNLKFIFSGLYTIHTAG